MSRRLAIRLAPVSEPPPEPWLTLEQLMAVQQVSRSSIERSVELGMPCVDIGHHHPIRRKKRALRFVLSEVRAWHEAQR